MTAADFGERLQRAFEVIILAEQRLPAGARRCGDADRTAAPLLVDEQHRACGLAVFNFDPGGLVSQLVRHRQMHLRGRRARLDRHRPSGQEAPVGATGPHLVKVRFGRRQGTQHDVHILGFPVACGEKYRCVIRPGGEILQAAAVVEMGGERLCAGAVVHAVAEPDRGVGTGEGEFLQARQRRLPVYRPGLRLQRVNRSARIDGADRRQRRRRGVAAGLSGGDEDDLAVLALRLGQQISECRLPRRPVARRRPAVVDNEDQRPAPRQLRLRVEQRMRRRDDRQRGNCHTQQNQPERRARRRHLARHQPQQQPNGREGDAPRRRRCNPQQPPDNRQPGQRRQ